MVKYLRKLPDESVEEWIRSRQQLIHDRKASAPSIGADSILIREQSPGIMWSGVLPNDGVSPSGGSRTLLVTATATNPAATVYAGAFAHIWINNPNGARYTPGDYLAALKAGGIGFRVWTLDYLPDVYLPNKKAWLFPINGNMTDTVYFKPIVRSPTSVTLSLQVIQ